MNVCMEYKLHDYVLFIDGKNTGEVLQLTEHEVHKMNYAFGLNRSNKRYILRSDINVTQIDTKSILILPEG